METNKHYTREELNKLIKAKWVLTDFENWTEKDRITFIGTNEEVSIKHKELDAKGYTMVWREPAW